MKQKKQNKEVSLLSNLTLNTVFSDLVFHKVLKNTTTAE